MRSLGLALVVGFALVALVGCKGEPAKPSAPPAQPASAPAPARAPAAGGQLDLRSFDFRNAVLPGGRGGTWTLKDGKAEKAEGGGEVRFAEVRFGDLDGDGREEAVVRLEFKGLFGGNVSGSIVEVYREAEGKLVSLGGQMFASAGDTFESMAVDGPRIVVKGGYHTKDDPPGRPSRKHESVYELKEGKLIQTRHEIKSN